MAKWRILIIEDNRDLADSFQVLLELLGYDVRTAYSGAQGVATAQAWRPDFVLSDIGLPGMDGYEVARAIRSSPSTANVCLVAITAYGSDEDREHTRAAGFDHHFTKPIDPAVMQSFLAAQAPRLRAG